MYCFDTDVLSAAVNKDPPLSLLRRLSMVPASESFTTAINLGEMLFGAAKAQNTELARRVRAAVSTIPILPFDEHSAERYAQLRADLEASGQTLHEPDLRIASIALANDLIMVTGNVKHFERIPGLRVESSL